MKFIYKFHKERNFKNEKNLKSLLCLCMCICSGTFVASASRYYDCAETMNEMGVFKGVASEYGIDCS